MPEQYYCPFCGSRGGSHFNAARHALVCDGCGHVIRDHASEQARRDLDRSLLRAQEHLRMQNWSEVLNIVRPLAYSSPSNPEVHRLIFLAATENCSAPLDSPNQAAATAWDKLLLLHAATPMMYAYVSRLKNTRRTVLMQQKEKRDGYLILFVISLVLFFVFGAVGSGGEWLMLISFISGAIGLCKSARYGSAPRELKRLDSYTGNPFLYE